jgi:tripartite-type tricarboxylate transporter receptor subunit TctC
MGLLAPAGTPRGIVENISQAANTALRAKEVEAALQAQGFQTIGTTPDAFADHIKAELKKWAGVASAAGLRK